MTASMRKPRFDGRGLRVCMLVRNDLVHDPRVTRHAETLGAHGYDVTVVCTASQRTPQLERRARYTIVRAGHGIPVALENLAQRSRPRSVFRLLVRLVQVLILQLALLRAARRTAAHVYCSNDLDTLLIGVLARRRDRRLIYDCHELWPDMLATVPEFVRRALRSYEGVLIERADIVTTVNELIAGVISTRYSLAVPIHTIYNCPLLGRRRKGKTKPRGTRRRIALYQGRFVPQRGLENLVRAAKYLLPDVEIVLRGYGPIETELRALAANASNVKFVRPVAMNRLVDAARDADVGIVPYVPSNLNNYLASPNKMFEYIHAGLPIAASDIPFMRRIVYENDIGVVFDPTDPQSIAGSLNKVTRAQELRRQRRMVVTTAAKYHWEIESRKLLRLYGRLGHELRMKVPPLTISTDEPHRLQEIQLALRRIARKLRVLFPIHPRARPRLVKLGATMDSGRCGVVYTRPMSDVQKTPLPKNARRVRTDSGGVRNKASLLRTPCATLRSTTERPETRPNGANRLLIHLKMISSTIIKIATEHQLELKIRSLRTPFWDGCAPARMAQIIQESFAW